jgi:septal ring factor EnvC (AmiA/AmiB activator)
MKRLLPVIAIFLLLVFPTGALPASDFAESEKRLEDVQKRLTTEEKRVKRFSRKESNVLGQIQKINKNLIRKKRELKRVERSLKRVRGDIRETEARITPLERERARLAGRLNKRLKAMYMMRNGTALNVLLSAGFEDTGEIARRSKYLTLLMDSDTSLIGDVKKNITSLQDERNKLDGFKKELLGSRNAALKSKREAESIKRKKLALLRNVKNKLERSIRVTEELKEASEELKALLEELRSGGAFGVGGFAAMRGRLLRPVRGRVVSRYGKVRHPKFKTVTFNNGIIIDSPVGVPVKSVYDGRVIFTGWLKGYGQLMILDNGSGYYTLYAHLDNILRERGDVVKKGDEIAIVGETGPQATPGLYFEIRERGVPRDPMKWLASR